MHGADARRLLLVAAEIDAVLELVRAGAVETHACADFAAEMCAYLAGSAGFRQAVEAGASPQARTALADTLASRPEHALTAARLRLE